MQTKAPGNSDVAGVILAGGRSSRMGGGDKALLDLGGRPMLAHVIDRIGAQAAPLVLNANGDPARFAWFNLPVVSDTVGGFAGPLAGVLAGLRWATATAAEARFVVSVPGDAPFLPADLVPRLREASEGSAGGIAVASSGGRVHPVAALWPLAIADRIEAALGRGAFKAHDFIAHAGASVVPFAFAHGVDPFFNANTPEDLHLARDLFARASAGPYVIGIAGWKNSGKTTLAVRLIAELTRRGFAVAAIKHSHHDIVLDNFALDADGTDSARLREAGACRVALVSPQRWGVRGGFAHEGPEPALAAVVAAVGPADVVVVEGYKRAPIAKIEVRREARSHEPLADRDPHFIGIAADHAVQGAPCPVFALDDIVRLADLVLADSGLPVKKDHR